MNNLIEMESRKALKNAKNNSYAMSVIFSSAGKEADCDVFVGSALEPENMVVGVAALVDTIVDMLDMKSAKGDKKKIYEKLIGEINDFSRLLVLGDGNDDK